MTWSGEFAFRDCPWCGLKDAQMNVLATDVNAGRRRGASRVWAFVSCPRCAGVVTLETSGQGARPEVRMVIPDDNRIGAQVGYLPDDVAKFYGDAQRVLDAGVPDAAAVQLRKTLEAAAAHFNIDSGPLVDRIKELISFGMITQPFGDVLDHIRKLGNVGAHSSDEVVNEEDAQRALRFTTQVLRNLFEIPAELAAVGQTESEANAPPAVE